MLLPEMSGRSGFLVPKSRGRVLVPGQGRGVLLLLGGCTAEVNFEVHVQTEMAAAPGQFIALQAINVVKEIISG